MILLINDKVKEFFVSSYLKTSCSEDCSKDCSKDCSERCSNKKDESCNDCKSTEDQ